jgi:CRP-like cAMP-binding protein
VERIGALGKVYQDGEDIVRQGDVGDCMYVIQEGRAEVLVEQDGKEIRVDLKEAGDFFGEMAIIEREVRMATVRALGQVRALTVDKRNFLRRIHEDPSLAYRVLQIMSHRVRELAAEVARLKSSE